ncbi:MAG TPA: HEAT repeat domain-containing protein [Methanoregulaceae archaeon]|nr:HEAT repeat domain-containing protein [Methanoregulaceae archaeon]
MFSLIPHLYIIPVILVALWYPKRGLQITVLIIAALVILTFVLYSMGISFDPILSLFNAGLDIMIFVAVALYAKDRKLVDQVFLEFLERSGIKEADLKSMYETRGRARVTFEGDFEEVIHALQSTDEDAREEAVRALGELNDPRAVNPLILALKDENRYVRREAAKSLGRIGDGKAISPLIEALKDEDRYGREGAAEGLAEMKEKAFVPLIHALNDNDWHVRMGAIIALRIIGDRNAIPKIIEALKDENRFVRREAAKSLGRIGDDRVIEPLTGALNDDDTSVRMRAVSALAKFSRDDVIDQLIGALNDSDSGVRLRAVQALEEINDPRGLRALGNEIKNEGKV